MSVYSFEGVAPVWNPEKVWIAPDAWVIGQVELGDDVSIWYGSVLRGDNDLISIGARTNIQEHGVLHTDRGLQLRVGEWCTIGHRVILHGCTIGNGTLVGMGATVMNRARVGARCIIGAGTLVTEGMEIPDDSLAVGAPARVVRTLTPERAAGIARSAQSYVDKSRRFRAGLVQL